MATDFIVVPKEHLSLLSAVNILITSLGESPVTAYDPPPTVEVDFALLARDAADQLVQGMNGTGWHWNREDALTLALDEDGRVALPSQTLMVTAAYYTPAQSLNVIPRGGYLYDRTNHTFTFSTAPTVDIVARLSWGELPAQARLYITYLAARAFQAQLQDRRIAAAVTETHVNMARLALEQFDDALARLNSVHGNVSVSSHLFGDGIPRLRQGL